MSEYGGGVVECEVEGEGVVAGDFGEGEIEVAMV